MRNSNARNSKKRIAAVAIITLILVGGGGAVTYAYWTAGGTGNGTATTGSAANVTPVQTSSVTGLAPGSAAQTLSGTFTNSNSVATQVNTVTVSIASVTEAVGAPTGYTCSAADYTLTGAAMTVNALIPVGSGQGAWSGATIAFKNSTTVLQDACKGATVNFTYTVS
jgi:hypothetical protein